MFARSSAHNQKQTRLGCYTQANNMFACILHNVLIEHPVPPDWFVNNVLEIDQEDELNQPLDQRDADTRRNQVFAYMLEEHKDRS